MTVTGGEPVSTADLAEVLSGIQTATVLYDTDSPALSQVTLSEDPNGFDYIEIYWRGAKYNSIQPLQYGVKLKAPLINTARLPMPNNTSSSAQDNQCVLNILDTTLTLTPVDTSYQAYIQRVIGIRSGGGSSLLDLIAAAIGGGAA